MFVAGGLLALEKYAKWKIFNYMPPLVWIYLLNMVFCTMGLFNSDAVSSAYDSLKNNLLYAMIFVMLLRCDFRKLAKLSGRMIAIFLGCSVTLAIGFINGRSVRLLGRRLCQHGRHAGRASRRPRRVCLRAHA